MLVQHGEMMSALSQNQHQQFEMMEQWEHNERSKAEEQAERERNAHADRTAEMQRAIQNAIQQNAIQDQRLRHAELRAQEAEDQLEHDFMKELEIQVQEDQQRQEKDQHLADLEEMRIRQETEQCLSAIVPGPFQQPQPQHEVYLAELAAIAPASQAPTSGTTDSDFSLADLGFAPRPPTDPPPPLPPPPYPPPPTDAPQSLVPLDDRRDDVDDPRSRLDAPPTPCPSQSSDANTPTPIADDGYGSCPSDCQHTPIPDLAHDPDLEGDRGNFVNPKQRVTSTPIPTEQPFPPSHGSILPQVRALSPPP